MNRVVFLDIDGVLNSEEYFINRDTSVPRESHEDYLVFNLDKILIDKLNKIIRQVKPIIVLSSSWRVYDMDKINRALRRKGFCSTIMFKTARPSNDDRGKEIKDLIQKNDVKDYVVIDDDSFDIESDIPKEQFIKTSWKKGLEDSHVNYITKYFNKER